MALHLNASRLTTLAFTMAVVGCSSSSTTNNVIETDAGATSGGNAGAVGGANAGGKSNNGGSSVGGVGGLSSAGGTSGIAGSETTGGNSGIAGSQSTGGATSVAGSSSTLAGGTPGTSTGGSSSAQGGTPSTGGTSTILVTGGAPTVGGAAAGGNSTTGGTSSTSVTTSTGGVATGGKTATGGVPTTGGVATGGAATGGVPATGGSSQISCTSGKSVCGSTCADLQTDKAHCGTCQTACEGYQFCAAGACLPHYVSTKVLPTAELATGASTQIRSANVQTNKAQGDLIIQLLLTDTSVTLSAQTDPMQTQVSAGTPNGASGYTAAALARYTATGTLVWGRDLLNVLGSTSDQPVYQSSITPFVVASNGDPVVAYRQADPPPTGPVQPTSQFWMARINGNNANRIWAANYSTDSDARTVVARSAKGDFISFGTPPDNYHGAGGPIWRVVDSGTSGTASYLGTNWSYGALSDGSTLWLWGCGYAGTYPINPWSSQTFNITGNPTQGGGSDAFILAAQDNGQSTGPWMSEGDWGPWYVVGMDAGSDLIVAARSAGYTTFNGGQDFIPQAGHVLVKIDHGTGQIVWRTDITAAPTKIITAPGGRIVTLTQQLDPTSQMPIPTAPYQLNIYSDSDGSLLSSISAGMMSQYVAAGTTDLFVLGVANAAADFNPGSATDSQGSTPGVYISRFSF